MGSIEHPHANFAAEHGCRYEQAPRRVYWELTRACALACRHCRAEAQKTRAADELSFDEACSVLRALSAAKPTPVVVLTGGDPLERPDLFEIITYAKGLGLHVDVAPSVTPKLTLAVVQQLAEHRVGAISLSLDGADAASHDRLRGIDGTFERTLEVAGAIVAAKIPLQINTLVTADTLSELARIRERVAAIGAKRWSLFFLVTTGRGSHLRQITSAQAEQLLEWVVEIAPRSPFVISTTEAPQLRRHLLRYGRSKVPGAGIRDGNGVLFISSRGELMPSGFLPLSAGSVRHADPLTVYRESPVFTALRDTSRFAGRCGRCDVKDVCGGSRGRAYAVSGDPLGEDPLCAYLPSNPKQPTQSPDPSS
jgi:MoaA/NifB/PqqE/SkfB family radical SAM enzyme